MKAIQDTRSKESIIEIIKKNIIIMNIEKMENNIIRVVITFIYIYINNI